MELNEAVGKYEAMVAPENYKRSSAPITQKMINNAMEKVKALGIESALTINNVLFADNSVKPVMGVFDTLTPTAPSKLPDLSKVDEVSIQEFLDTVLPKAETLEVMVSNNQANSFVSLVAPVDASASNILAWNNNFSWSYNGDLTDSSLRQRVKTLVVM